MARDVTFDFRRGGGSTLEVLYGTLQIEPTAVHEVGTATVLSSPTKTEIVNGQATLTGVESSPDGPAPAWAYKVTVSRHQGGAWSFLVGVPTGTTDINFTDLPQFVSAGVKHEVSTAPHASTHAAGGSDPLTPAAIGAATTARVTLLDGQGQRGYTIDQTAGRTVKVWDYLNGREQMIYGDTGWRALAATDSGSGEIHVRRNGNLVTIRLNGVLLAAGSFAAYFATLPTGFRCTSTEHYMIGSAGGNVDWQKIGIYGGGGAKVAWIQTFGGSSTRPSGALTGESTFTTSDPWPTTLPGSSIGTIPNA